MALLECINAAFAYEGRVVIRGLNFAVERGDYLCVVGENGSGKSTLIKGLLKLKAPCEGRVQLGEELTSKGIGYLPQKSAAQADFPANVMEVVLSGCLSRRGLMPGWGAGNRQRAREQMESLGIWAMRRRSFRELSGGQQQRVLLARALCATDSMLLLDEPMAGLDPVITGELYALLAQLNKAGLTVVMVSHDIHSAVHHASKILHLKQTQVFFGSTADYLKTESGKHFMACAGLEPDV
ncbi:MAG: metal ABC transporter ATP-binding protein [Clostridium sp.]|jgi:zinc transport system ATP-binding protein|nr:metal ABC transporter ATP-binding protein [Clostridium sp.]